MGEGFLGESFSVPWKNFPQLLERAESKRQYPLRDEGRSPFPSLQPPMVPASSTTHPSGDTPQLPANKFSASRPAR